MRELPSPLIPPPFSQKLGQIDFHNITKEERKIQIKEALLGFPRENQGTMYLLWSHLNKMARQDCVKIRNNIQIIHEFIVSAYNYFNTLLGS